MKKTQNCIDIAWYLRVFMISFHLWKNKTLTKHIYALKSQVESINSHVRVMLKRTFLASPAPEATARRNTANHTPRSIREGNVFTPCCMRTSSEASDIGIRNVLCKRALLQRPSTSLCAPRHEVATCGRARLIRPRRTGRRFGRRDTGCGAL